MSTIIDSLREMLELRDAGQAGRITEKHELDIVRDARAALEAARLRGDGEQGQAVAWQPIGTAPDNELVMVAIDKPGYSGMMFATYRDHQWYADDRDQTPFGGWTHWCPLPPMPSAALSTQPAPSEQVAASVAVPDEAIRQALVTHVPRVTDKKVETIIRYIRKLAAAPVAPTTK